jgi:hypothetical protein
MTWEVLMVHGLPPARFAVTHRWTSGPVAGNRNGSTMPTYPSEEQNGARRAKCSYQERSFARSI